MEMGEVVARVGAAMGAMVEAGGMAGMEMGAEVGWVGEERAGVEMEEAREGEVMGMVVVGRVGVAVEVAWLMARCR
jgi:hypothetical protein